MAFLDFLRRNPGGKTETRSALSMDEWMSYFAFDNNIYPITGLQTMGGTPDELGDTSFHDWARATIKRNGVVFGCIHIRAAIFSEARFMWRESNQGRPGKVFADRNLRLLQQPWPRGSTDQMLKRALVDVDMAGNYFAVRRRTPQGVRLRRCRPDLVDIVLATTEKVEGPIDGDPATILDLDPVGIRYWPNGRHNLAEPLVFPIADVVHWAPMPDPDHSWRGMSWMTPIMRDVAADNAASTHKDKFFRNAATPNLMVKLDISDPERFKEWVELFQDQHQGGSNAYKTLFIGAGADPKVIGANFQQMDFKNTIGAGENRIAMAAGVPPTILGTSEGMQGSTLNAGNYNSSRRRFADGTMRPLWRSACSAFAPIVEAPENAELWYDDRDIAFLQEDKQDEADIFAKVASAVRTLTDAGWDPDAAIAAAISGDLDLLSGNHSGFFSVQLLAPQANDGNVTTDQEDDTP